jgi:hypothetical protein
MGIIGRRLVSGFSFEVSIILTGKRRRPLGPLIAIRRDCLP